MTGSDIVSFVFTSSLFSSRWRFLNSFSRYSSLELEKNQPNEGAVLTRITASHPHSNLLRSTREFAGKTRKLGLVKSSRRRRSDVIITTSMFQVSQVGEVLRALGTNPTEGEVKKLIQSTVTVSWIHIWQAHHHRVRALVFSSHASLQALVCKHQPVCILW